MTLSISGIRWRLIVWPSVLLVLMGAIFIWLNYQASLKQLELAKSEQFAAITRLSEQLLTLQAARMSRLSDDIVEEMSIRRSNGGYQMQPNARLQGKLLNMGFMQGVRSVSYYDPQGNRRWIWGGEASQNMVAALVKAASAQDQPVAAIMCDTKHCAYWQAKPILYQGATIGSVLLESSLESFVVELRRIAQIEVGLVTTTLNSSARLDSVQEKVLLAAGEHMKQEILQKSLRIKKKFHYEYVAEGQLFWLSEIPLPTALLRNDVQLYALLDVTKNAATIRAEWLSNVAFVLLAVLFSMLLMHLLLLPILKSIRQLSLALPLIGEERFAEVDKVISFVDGRYIPDELDRISFAVLALSARLKKLIEVEREQTTALQQERDLMASLLANVPVMILVCNARGIIKLCNPAVAKLLGKELSEVVGGVFSELLLAPEDCDICQKIQQHGSYQSTSRVRTPAGLMVEIVWSHVRLPMDIDGQNYLSVGTDVTRRRAMEFELAHADEQRVMLVREVHHRIKNNLQGAVGLLAIYADQHPDIRTILLEVISQIKSIAVVFGLQGKCNAEAISLAEMLAEVVAVNVELTHANIQLTQLDSLACAVLLPDKAVSIALVINELIVNAVKYNAVQQSPIHINCSYGQDNAMIAISNQAMGLAELFDFSQGVGLGTGLTLARFMLPKQGANLSFQQTQGNIIATLKLQPPVIAIQD